MSLTIIADLPITLITKRIRNLNLRISPPDGKITISVPYGYPYERIETFVRSKSHWIQKHQERIRKAPYVPPLRFETGEEHLFLGEKYRLFVVIGKKRCVEWDLNIERLQDSKFEVLEDQKVNDISTLPLFDQDVNESTDLLQSRILRMTVTSRMSRKEREGLMESWYRARLKEFIPLLLKKYEAIIPVRSESWGVKKMRTKWGTCNTRTKKIWISLMLAKQPLSELEHVIVHELVHLIERKHNARFHSLVKNYLSLGNCQQ